MSLFNELKRRNVFKVGVAYVIAAWALLQLVDILLPAFAAPPWVLRVVVLFLALGFMVALFVAWAFELTPDGIKRTSEVDPASSIRVTTGEKLNILVISALSFALLFMATREFLRDDAEPATDSAAATAPVALDSPAAEAPASTVLPNSVAVLPFENLSPDANDAFFASGIHDELLHQLAKIRDLNVIARTSVLPYAGSSEGIPAIAKALNVMTVMEGSVRYADGNVRVTAQLIDAATDAHLWSETYTRPFSNIFEIQTEIAMAIANALQAEFSLAEQASIAQQSPSSSPEAYALFVRAMQVWQSSGPIPAVLKQVMADMQRVVALDPEFAQPYAVLADISAELMYGDVGTPENWQERVQQLEQQALAYAEQALALDPSLGYAHSAIAKIHQQYWREEATRSAFARALELSPNDPEVLIELSWFHAFAQEPEEAIRLGRRAVELDPNNSDLWERLGVVYLMTKQRDAGLSATAKAIAANPANAIAYLTQAPDLARRGRTADALAGLRTVELLAGDSLPGFAMSELAIAYALSGSAVDARRIFDQLAAMAEEKRIGAYSWAFAYLAIGDQAAALAALNEAAENKVPDEGAIFLPFIRNNTYNVPMLEQPEFVEVRKRLGFTDE